MRDEEGPRVRSRRDGRRWCECRRCLGGNEEARLRRTSQERDQGRMRSWRRRRKTRRKEDAGWPVLPSLVADWEAQRLASKEAEQVRRTNRRPLASERQGGRKKRRRLRRRQSLAPKLLDEMVAPASAPFSLPSPLLARALLAPVRASPAPRAWWPSRAPNRWSVWCSSASCSTPPTRTRAPVESSPPDRGAQSANASAKHRTGGTDNCSGGPVPHMVKGTRSSATASTLRRAVRCVQ